MRKTNPETIFFLFDVNISSENCGEERRRETADTLDLGSGSGCPQESPSLTSLSPSHSQGTFIVPCLLARLGSSPSLPSVPQSQQYSKGGSLLRNFPGSFIATSCPPSSCNSVVKVGGFICSLSFGGHELLAGFLGSAQCLGKAEQSAELCSCLPLSLSRGSLSH